MSRANALAVSVAFYFVAVFGWLVAVSWLQSTHGLGKWGADMISVGVGGGLAMVAMSIYFYLTEEA